MNERSEHRSMPSTGKPHFGEGLLILWNTL